MEAFAQFGSDLDKSTLAQLERGKRLIEILKQDQYNPLNIAEQIAIIYAAVEGYLDNVPVDKVKNFEKELLSILNMQYAETLTNIRTKKVLDNDVKDSLNKAIKECQGLFVE